MSPRLHTHLPAQPAPQNLQRTLAELEEILARIRDLIRRGEGRRLQPTDDGPF